MAVFPNGAEDGVKAAIAKLRQVNAYNEHRAQDGWQPINIGIGVHTGHMMVGMVGEQARIQGDAFSDNVNLTARLEGLTKYYGVSFLISGETYQAIDRTPYHIRFLDYVAVKGKVKSIAVYEIFDADAPELFERRSRFSSKRSGSISTGNLRRRASYSNRCAPCCPMISPSACISNAPRNSPTTACRMIGRACGQWKRNNG